MYLRALHFFSTFHNNSDEKKFIVMIISLLLQII